MSSVIEVLKDRKKCLEDFMETKQYMGKDYSHVKTPRTEAEIKALGEALLALEKQEKLKAWLEKRIESNQKRLDWQKQHGEIMFAMQICEGLEQRIADYKEVLGELQ